MCLLLSLMLGGPRVAIVVWWLLGSDRWEAAYDTFIVPFLGFVFLPWTTLMFVVVAPAGAIAGSDWVWLGLALIIDLASHGGGGYRSRYAGRGY
ncbi:MAG: hypothetical protein QNJ75_02065 [Acidimicrobiia bacterium]|nr:hypothetical protein [Acidimicrobiia bacterium]